MSTSATFTVSTPTSGGGNVQCINIDATGSALDPIAQDAPVLLNEKHDLALSGAGTGTGILSVRVSAPNTIRIGVKGLNSSLMPTFDVLITAL